MSNSDFQRFQVRVFQDSDLPRIREIFSKGVKSSAKFHPLGEAYAEHVLAEGDLASPQSLRDTFFKEARDQNISGSFWVVLDTSASPPFVVGHVGLETKDPVEGVGELRCMFVDEIYREHKLGKKLVNALLTHAQTQHYRRIDLFCALLNARAIKFYQKCHFQISDVFQFSDPLYRGGISIPCVQMSLHSPPAATPLSSSSSPTSSLLAPSAATSPAPLSSFSSPALAVSSSTVTPAAPVEEEKDLYHVRDFRNQDFDRVREIFVSTEFASNQTADPVLQQIGKAYASAMLSEADLSSLASFRATYFGSPISHCSSSYSYPPGSGLVVLSSSFSVSSSASSSSVSLSTSSSCSSSLSGCFWLLVHSPTRRVIGQVGLELKDSCTRSGELRRMGIESCFRGRFLGTRLVIDLLAHAQKQQFHEIFLTVPAANVRAIHFYEKFGFVTDQEYDVSDPRLPDGANTAKISHMTLHL